MKQHPLPSAILARYRELSTAKSLGQRAFAKQTGFSTTLWNGIHWTSWKAFVQETGLAPNLSGERYSRPVLMRMLAELTHHYGHYPSQGEIKYAYRHPIPKWPTDLPPMAQDSVFWRRFKSKSDSDQTPSQKMRAALTEWVSNNEQYQDVLQILKTSAGTTRLELQSSSGSLEPQRPLPPYDDLESYLPPVVACIPKLARADPELIRQIESHGADHEKDFERRISIAFSLMGLESNPLGQGHGRVADGLAICVTSHWAVVFDAKIRRNGYNMSTEDRKFREYIEKHEKDLERRGVAKFYFAVVSSSFDESDLEKLREIVRKTRAKSFVLLEADALMKILDFRLREPSKFDFDHIERCLSQQRIVTAEHVLLTRNRQPLWK